MLTNEHIVLRAMEPKDASILYKWENDRKLWHVSETISPYSLHQLENFIQQSLSQDIYSSKELRMMISDGKDTVFGIIDLFQFDPKHRRIGIGVLIHREYRNKGIASEAIRLSKEYVFKHLQLNQIWCTISVNNTESIQLFKKSEFIETGKLLSWNLNHDSKYEDVIFMQCIKKQTS